MESYTDHIEKLLGAQSELAKRQARKMRQSGARDADTAADHLLTGARLADIENTIRDIAAQIERLLTHTGLDLKVEDTVTLDNADGGAE